MKRRQFIKQASILATASLIPIGINSWVARTNALTSNRKRLIVIFLRGGVDGLNVVVPYRESIYYEARPTIAIAPPSKKEGVLNLDGRFGLNPALAEIMPLWKQGSLAFIHGCGSPDSTRSHFDAQDYMESGTPGIKNTQEGWMNRLLAILPKDRPTQAVNVGNTTPRILQGTMPVAHLPVRKQATRPMALDRPRIDAAFDRLYGGNDPLSLAYQEGDEARRIILEELNTEMMNANGGAASPGNFAKDASKLAQLMVGDGRTQLGFMALGGWDTHVNETNQLNRNLKSLAGGLKALTGGLGNLYQHTAIAVISEFGRTVAENGNGGTDHGHGNVMWVLGGSVRGGKVYGQWPGLEKEELFEGRDLAVTTDFREAIASLLVQHLQVSSADLREIFPGYVPQNNLRLLA